MMKRILKKYELFQSLPPADLSALARVAIIKQVQKGEYICYEGEKMANFHLVYSGKIKVVKHTTFGKDVILDICSDGEVFLIEPIFDGEGYPASAVAVEDSSVLLIDRRKLVRYMDQNPKMMRTALKEMANHMRTLNTQIKELSVGKVDYRIANMMLKLGEKIGERDQQGQVRVAISLSRQDIADLTGTTIETAIRTMRRFAKQDLVETTKDTILIKDRDGLEDIAVGL